MSLPNYDHAHSIEPAIHIPDIQSAHAILLLGDEHILQLRELKPGIAAPGRWSLFGGRINSECETPLEAISREIHEELSIQPEEFNYLCFADYFAAFEGEVIRTWLCSADASSVWSEHMLHEGMGVGAFQFEQVPHLRLPPFMRQAIERFYRQEMGSSLL